MDLFRKLLLRRSLLSSALPGAFYCPFLGDGDIAAEVYAGRRIYGADLDPARIVTARGRFADSDLRVADCDGWPFPDVTESFAVADFDAYANPYRGLAAFWSAARKAPRIVVFGTDGMRQRIKRGKVMMTLPRGDETPAESAAFRQQYNFWWGRYVLPYLRRLVAPARIGRTQLYLRRDMVYWGMVVEGANVPPSEPHGDPTELTVGTVRREGPK